MKVHVDASFMLDSVIIVLACDKRSLMVNKDQMESAL